MPADERPTNAERADAADRFIAAVDAAVADIHAAMQVLRERQERSSSGRTGPLFPFVGDALHSMLDQARDKLWAAHKEAASYAYDQHHTVDPPIPPPPEPQPHGAA